MPCDARCAHFEKCHSREHALAIALIAHGNLASNGPVQESAWISNSSAARTTAATKARPRARCPIWRGKDMGGLGDEARTARAVMPSTFRRRKWRRRGPLVDPHDRSLLSICAFNRFYLFGRLTNQCRMMRSFRQV
jgi:hypothetical protein